MPSKTKENVSSVIRVTFFFTSKPTLNRAQKEVLFNWTAEKGIQKLPWKKKSHISKHLEKALPYFCVNAF